MSCERAAYCLIWFLMMVGTTLLITSTVTSYWRGSGNYHVGLFESCAPECEFLEFFKGDDGECWSLNQADKNLFKVSKVTSEQRSNERSFY